MRNSLIKLRQQSIAQLSGELQPGAYRDPFSSEVMRHGIEVEKSRRHLYLTRELTRDGLRVVTTAHVYGLLEGDDPEVLAVDFCNTSNPSGHGQIEVVHHGTPEEIGSRGLLYVKNLLDICGRMDLVPGAAEQSLREAA